MSVTPEFGDAEVPPPRHAGYNASDKGKERRKKYRAENPGRTTAFYLSRPFIGWDGEGITRADGSHDYVMLANSLGEERISVMGLSTKACFDFLLDTAERNPDAIHVIYGGGYDFNCMFADLSRKELERVYSGKYPTVRGYRLDWRPGKSLFVSDGKRNVTLYDVVSFFQCAFVKACDDYLGESFYERDLIVAQKEARSHFDIENVAEIRRYNDAELVNLVALMNELRERLNKVGLRPGRWDGPGAIASALLKRQNIKSAMSVCPPAVAKAARFAYAGGRFEVVRFGHVEAPAYEYDINSAYPSALRYVPNLNTGTWTYVKGDPGNQPFALYHVVYQGGPAMEPAPLFRRDANGSICYPTDLSGWYWSPEIEVAREYAALHGGKLTIIEAHVYSGTDERPFSFIEPLYLKRKALKKAGDGAHVGIKLALNSIYGKLAQQIGWEPATATRPMRTPPFHQLEWAGYVTSHARATVLRAALRDLGSIIAFETDAVFSSAPLDLPIGSGLGEFEVTEFADLTYVQSGLYFGRTVGGDTVSKTRGVDRGSLTRDQVLDALRSGENRAEARLSRFVGAGIALAQNFERWRRWETNPKVLTLAPSGKRQHYGCSFCELGSDRLGLTLGVWHTTVCPFLGGEHSSEFPVEWINPDEAMTELSELRRESAENEYE